MITGAARRSGGGLRFSCAVLCWEGLLSVWKLLGVVGLCVGGEGDERGRLRKEGGGPGL